MVVNRKKMVVNLLANGIVFLVQMVINFWLSPFILDKLGEEAHGFVTLANNFTQYMTLIAITINSMACRFISIEYNGGRIESAKQYFSSVFWMNVFFSILVCIVAIVVVLNIHVLNVSEHLVQDIKISFLLNFFNLMISFMSTCYASTTFVCNQMDLNAYIQIAVNIIKFIGIFFLYIFFTPRIYYVFLVTVISSVCSFVLFWKTSSHLIPEFGNNISYFKRDKVMILASAGFWVLISDVSSVFLNGFDLLIANQFITTNAMGRLSVSKIIPTAIGVLLGTISSVFTASFTKTIAAKKTNALLNEVNFSLKILAFILVVPFAGIIVYGKDFLTEWLPHGVYNSIEINQIYILMILTLINVIINGFMYSVHSVLIALNKIKVYSVMVFIASVISIIMTIFLVTNTTLDLYAISGTSTIVLGIINLIVVPLYVERVLKVKRYTLLRKIAKSYFLLFILCGLFLGAKYIIQWNGLLQFLGWMIIIGLCGYFLMLVILFNKTEYRQLLYKIMKK